MQWQGIATAPFAAAFLGLILVASAPAARAQSDLQTLSDKLDRLQQELSDVERQVYNGQAPAGGQPTGGAVDSSAAASQEVRIQQLEGQLSSITGQIEQLNYNLRQLSTRLDKLSQDVDFRLNALEHGQPAAGGMANTGTPVAGADQQPTTIISGTQPALQPPLQPPLQPNGQPIDPNAPLKQSSLAPTTLGTLTQGQMQTAAAIPPPPPSTNGTQPGVPATGNAASYQLPGNTVEAQYEYAFNLLRQANYDEAQKALQAFVVQHPTDSLAGNAQYWLGETYYVRGRYQDAAVAFAEAYQKYPNSNKAPDNLLKLGMALGQIGKKSDACVAFGELNKKFPGAPDSLKERLKQEKHRYGCS
jgi:tol-pal system protein YbgF